MSRISKTNFVSKIQASHQRVKEQFSNLDSQTLNMAPSSEAWSIGQCLDHIVKANASYFPIFESLMDGTYRLPFMGRLPLFPKIFGNMILSYVQPDRQKKSKTFEIWEPVQTDIPTDILKTFDENQAEIKEWFEKLEALLNYDPVISSPANSKIVYRLSNAFRIIALHQERHVAQAEEVLASLQR